MRRTFLLVATAVAVLASVPVFAGCDGSRERPKWVGEWRLEKERTAQSVMEYEKAERARAREMMKAAAKGPMGGPPPMGRDPSDEMMLAQARRWMAGMKADLDLRADGTAAIDLYFGGT